MQNFTTRLHTALTTIRGYTLRRAAELESRRSALHRELSALQNSYLDLSLQASRFAQQRNAIIEQLQRTLAYIDPDNPPAAGDAAGTKADKAAGSILAATKEKYEYNLKTDRWKEYLITFREFFTPYTRSLEIEIAALLSEFERLEKDYLLLAEQANTLAGERDAATADLDKARARISSSPASSGDTVAVAPPGKTIDELEQALATERAAAAEQQRFTAQKLHRTQTEKTDLAISLAEEQSRGEELRVQREQLGDEIRSLNEQLARAENQRNALQQENRTLSGQLAQARQDQNGSRQHIDELEQHSRQLEGQLAAAQQSIDDLELSLAEAAYRQEVADKQAALHEQSHDRLKAKLADSHADNERLAKQLHAPASAPPGKQHDEPVKWTRLAAGFLFLLGILASAGKLWQTTDNQPRLGSISKDVLPATTPLQKSAAEPATPALTTTNKVRIAAMEAGTGKPAAVARRTTGPVSPAEKKTKRVRLPFTQGRGDTRFRGNTGAPSRTWIMDPGDTKTARIKACAERGLSTEECEALENNLFSGSVISLPGGIQYKVLENGIGVSPGIDDTVLVNYKGMLLNGQVFDSTTDQGGAVSFRLDELIAGLQDALQYMEEGARWEIYIPGDLAFKKPARYGGQTLVFEVELLAVDKPAQPADVRTPDDDLPISAPSSSRETGPATLAEDMAAASRTTGTLPKWLTEALDSR